MGLYNFKAQFVPFILSGRKTHTIRAPRKNVERVGNTMHLYTGLRQKGAKLLLRSPCVKVENILITPGHVVRIDSNYLEPDECELLAQRDGFRDFKEMMAFWDGRLPFIGHVIHWKAK
jgi:hypothetical protein